MDSTVSEKWAENPLVRTAARISGWPDCPIADFLETLGQVIETVGDLQRQGMSLADLLDLSVRARLAEEDETRRREYDRPLEAKRCTKPAAEIISKDAMRAVYKLHANGFEPELIARLLEVPVERVEHYMGRVRLGDNQHRILELHREGVRPAEIARELGMARQSVERVLTRAGVVRHRKAVDDLTKKRIIALAGAGKGPAEIAAEVGTEKWRVKNVLSGARKRAEL